MLTLVQCKKETTCTYDLRSVTLTLQYPDGQAVLLDSGNVLQISTNQIVSSWSGASASNNYTIVNDNKQEELEGKQETMRFTGFLNGEIVCQRDVLVGADRCHVQYLGKESLVQVIYDVPNKVLYK